MKVFTAAQIRAWDAFTVKEQDITSDTLMQRAAAAAMHWIAQNGYALKRMYIFCGKGNNGGDGIALAQMLLQYGTAVQVYILEQGKAGSHDFQLNLQRLQQVSNEIHYIQSEYYFPSIEPGSVIVDALFGTGLHGPLEGISFKLVEYLNNSGCEIVSLDIPSGVYTDNCTTAGVAIHAAHTLSFQNVKKAFLMPENGKFTGRFHFLNIGLSKHFEDMEPAAAELTDKAFIRLLLRPRKMFSHKGNYGHAALLAGSSGMMGAAMLAARGCLACGTGKLTCYVPAEGIQIMQVSVPEAMCREIGGNVINNNISFPLYDAIGIGPGIGQTESIHAVLTQIFNGKGKNLILDADALNVLGTDKKLLEMIPEGSIITPHIKEFERLFGTSTDDFSRLELAVKKAAALKIYIILKGHFTALVTPFGRIFFNATGNAGMAKGGMGDVLTGMITGFCAQHYPMPEAALIAVYLHGLAGDIAAARYSQEAMQATDLINCIPEAWLSLWA